MLSSIIESIQYPVFIKDDEIKNMQLSRLLNGDPERWTGGFAVVFHFTSQNQDYAFRCLHTPISDDIETRWLKISTYLSLQKCNYLCEFQYNKVGLVANGICVPTVKMAWVNGKSLDRFIADNKSNARQLRKLADNFLKVTKQMHQHKIAHGDLQHENIIVDDFANITLVDYDSAYVPTMNNFKDVIHGKPNYQHPQRFKNLYSSEKLDYFSQLIIYLSILAYSENPQLIPNDITSEESLLFKHEEWQSLSSLRQSKVYSQIKVLSLTCQSLLKILEHFVCSRDINDLIPFYLHEDYYTIRPAVNFCSNCGYKFISAKDNYCTNCGLKRYIL